MSCSAWLLAGWLGVGHAAANDTVAVLAPGVTDDRATLRAVARLVDAEPVSAATWLAAVDVHALPAVSCDDPVVIEAWRARVGDAERALQRLSFAPALAALVGLEVDLTCLRTPPTTADLQRLELDLGAAYHYQARGTAADTSARQLYTRERDAALQRAAAWGAGLAVPTDLPAELRSAFLAARERVAAGPTVRVLVREGLRWDGRVAAGEPMVVPAGTHVAFAQGHAGELVGALVELPPGRDALIWAPRGVEAVVDPPVALARLAHPEPGDGPLLAALVTLRGDAVFVSPTRGRVEVWRLEDGEVRPVRPVATADGSARLPEVGERWAIGVGGALGVSTLGGGSLDGLGGITMGPALGVRFAVASTVAIELSTRLLGAPSARRWEDGGGVLFRATMPILAGLSWARRGPGSGGSVGGFVGVDVLGAYPDAAFVAPLCGAAAGWAGGGTTGWWATANAGMGWAGRVYPRVTVEGGVAWRR